MIQQHPFALEVGAQRLHIPPMNARVPAGIWEILSVAVVLESQGFDRIVRHDLSRLGARIHAESQERTWFLLRVMPQQERMLRDALAEKGIRAYVPVQVSKPLQAKRKASRSRALIPGYVFVNLPDDDAIDTARNMHGVIEIMCREGKPRRVPAMAIANLVFFEACHEFDETWEPPKAKGHRYTHRWKPNDRVRINDGGPLNGFLATVGRGQGRDRMQVLLSIFGRPTEVVIEHRHLIKPE